MVVDLSRLCRTKGAIQLHLLLDHQDCLPYCELITNGKSHDVKAARLLEFAPEAILAIDHGHFDHDLFGCWTYEGLRFVPLVRLTFQQLGNL